MDDQSSNYNELTLKGTTEYTCSQGLGGGTTPSNSQDGLPTGRCGQGVAPANPSVQPANERGLPTAGTSGLRCLGSLESASLQRSLANKLRQRMQGIGSLEYSLTWKDWGMPSREPICAQRGRALPTSDKGCGGWPTPNTNNTKGAYQDDDKNMARTAAGRQVNLQDMVRLAGWSTPTVPRAHDSDQTAGRWYPNTKNQMDPTIQLLGRDMNSCPVPMEKRGALNPAFSLWLMGFPVKEWLLAAPSKNAAPRFRPKKITTSAESECFVEQVMPSSPKLQRTSSKRSLKQSGGAE